MTKIIKTKQETDIDNKFQKMINIIRNLDITLSLFIQFMGKSEEFKKYFDTWVEEQKKKQEKEQKKEQNKGE